MTIDRRPRLESATEAAGPSSGRGACGPTPLGGVQNSIVGSRTQSDPWIAGPRSRYAGKTERRRSVTSGPLVPTIKPSIFRSRERKPRSDMITVPASTRGRGIALTGKPPSVARPREPAVYERRSSCPGPDDPLRQQRLGDTPKAAGQRGRVCGAFSSTTRAEVTPLVPARRQGSAGATPSGSASSRLRTTRP